MNIAIIGFGKIGRALAAGFSARGHTIIAGMRAGDLADREKQAQLPGNVLALTIAEAVQQSEVIIISVPLASVPEIATSLGDTSGKIIIETTNAFGKPLKDYGNGTDALKKLTGNEDIVKCFSTVGFETMANPVYGVEQADLFVAGNSEKARLVAIQLSKDLGFGNCYILGGNEALPMMENIALLWGNLAFKTGLGRNMAFKILKH